MALIPANRAGLVGPVQAVPSVPQALTVQNLALLPRRNPLLANGFGYAIPAAAEPTFVSALAEDARFQVQFGTAVSSDLRSDMLGRFPRRDTESSLRSADRRAAVQQFVSENYVMNHVATRQMEDPLSSRGAIMAINRLAARNARQQPVVPANDIITLCDNHEVTLYCFDVNQAIDSAKAAIAPVLAGHIGADGRIANPQAAGLYQEIRSTEEYQFSHVPNPRAWPKASGNIVPGAGAAGNPPCIAGGPRHDCLWCRLPI